MADSTLFAPVEINFTKRKRGDTKPFRFQRKANGAAIDITGYTFVMTGNTNPAPSDDTAPPQVFELAGTITDAANGIFEFAPAAGDVDLVGKIFYEVQEKTPTPDSKLQTIVEGYIKFDQDIAKAT